MMGDDEAHGYAEVLAVAVEEAMGLGRPQNWDRAFAALQLAAQRGSTSALAQQALLGRGSAPVAAELIVSPPRETLSERPRVRILRGFATPAECDWLIKIAGGKLSPAQVWDAATGAGRADPNRTNRALELTVADMDVVVAVIRARISAATNIPVPVFEPPQVMHYRPGEEFRPHHDFLDPSEHGYAKELERFGQRIATFLIYLNDDYEGGETIFPDAGIRHRGQKGDALLFANVDAATRVPDPLTLHAGLPPTQGEKWIFSQWIRDRSPAGPR
jgi:predicted 2-oxoglutarate/Fe(II)-dependent dioxygenase YbiX